MTLQHHLRYVINAHASYPKKPINAFRLWDQQTPYSIHPLWCAMTIATETTLPEKIRKDGMITLLYHDILEDTTKKLPLGLNQNVCHLIRDMTFSGGINEEIKKIWHKSKEVRLLKLYDKVSNLLDGIWMKPDKRTAYQQYVEQLIKDVEHNYTKLNIIRIARAINNVI